MARRHHDELVSELTRRAEVAEARLAEVDAERKDLLARLLPAQSKPAPSREPAPVIPINYAQFNPYDPEQLAKQAQKESGARTAPKLIRAMETLKRKAILARKGQVGVLSQPDDPMTEEQAEAAAARAKVQAAIDQALREGEQAGRQGQV